MQLLVLALGFIAGTPQAAADEIILKSHTGATWERADYVGLVGSWKYWQPASIVTESETANTYGHGAGRTNMSRSFQELTYIYFEPEFPAYDYSWDTSFRYTTNRDTFAWGTDALLPGIRTDSDHSIECFWLSSASTLWTNYNNVVVTTNIPAPAALSSAWPLGSYGVMMTNYDGTNITGTTTNGWTDETTLSLATSGTDTNNSALFCLTGDVLNNFTADHPTTGWKLAGLVPDTQKRVFKVLNDASTSDASVSLDSSLTNGHHSYSCEVAPARVGLVMEWKGNGTNDTNWSQTTTLYVLKGTTVNFRVITPGFVDVTWPTGLPTWSGGGSSSTNTEFAVTFDTISADTNGQLVIVTAGSKATNRVVVCDFKIMPIPVDMFPGRTFEQFGVGEIVDLVPTFLPIGFDEAPLTLDWTCVRSHAWTSQNTADWSVFDTNGSTVKFMAGSEPETVAISAAIAFGPSAGMARGTNVVIVAPTNAILLELLPEANLLGGNIVTHTNIAHTRSNSSCGKRALYFIQPENVSFQAVKFSEGYGTGNLNDRTSGVAYGYDVGLDGSLTASHRTFNSTSLDHSPSQSFVAISHTKSTATNFFRANGLTTYDTFGWGIRCLDSHYGLNEQL